MTMPKLNIFDSMKHLEKFKDVQTTDEVLATIEKDQGPEFTAGLALIGQVDNGKSLTGFIVAYMMIREALAEMTLEKLTEKYGNPSWTN